MHTVAKAGLRWTWAALFALGCVAVAAYAFAFLTYRPYNPHDPFMVKFAVSGLALPVHFFGGGLALLLAPLQASAWLRRRAPTLHRIGGGLSIGGIFAAGIAGLVLAFDAHRGWASGAAFALLSLTWLTVTGIGVRHALRRDFAAHRRWMLRSIALTSSAITLRIILGTGMALQLPFDPVYIFAAWACWPVNLLLCEAWLRLPQWRARRNAKAMVSAFALRN